MATSNADATESPRNEPAPEASFEELFAQHRDRLRRTVQLRLDRRLQGRIDPSDVLQEAYFEAATRLGEYQRNPAMPPFLWLRFITVQRLLRLHRQHLSVQARDAAREVPIDGGTAPAASSALMAVQIADSQASPSNVAMRQETSDRLELALNRLDEGDREVLALRHSEQLSNAEVASVLGIQESAASKRYLRAIARLKELLRQMPGGLEELITS